MAIRHDVLILWKPGNIMAEMQGCQELKKFVRKGGMSVSPISQSRCLSGSVMETWNIYPTFVYFHNT